MKRLVLILFGLGDLFTIFSRIPRAFNASLIPINRPLTFEEKRHKLSGRFKGYSRRKFSIVFLFLYFLICN
jgi:hypothetical protein